MGHKNIAHIAGPQEWFDARRRLHGWNDALDQISVSNRFSLFGDWSAESGYDAMKELVKNKKITAVFAANDAMALGALKFLNEQKIGVPDEISVIGFDDISESSYFIPSLSTIQQDFQALGSAAIKLLLQRIRQEKISSPRTYIDPKLIIRNSVKNITN
jgi:DNA-binding LacI/PurR family transcriptional regulator